MKLKYSYLPVQPAHRTTSVLLWAFVVVLITACATVPITGRSQLMLVSDDQISHASEAPFNSFISAALQKHAIVTETDSPDAARAIAIVNRVGNAVIEASGLRTRYNWDILLVKSNACNAMVVPNGKIIVFTGLFSAMQNEAQLAAVIGHEIAHVVARHKAERLSQVLLSHMVMGSVNLALSNSKYHPMISSALGLGIQYAVLLPYSREHESEADHIGLIYMAKAGYEPSEAIGLWDQMEASERRSSLDFFSTHPSPETRRKQIKGWLPEATVYYRDPSLPLPGNLAQVEKTVTEAKEEPASAPEAMLPKYPPGFWYQGKLSNRSEPVTYRVEEDVPCGDRRCIKHVSSAGETVLYSSEGVVLEIRKSDNSYARFDPPLRLAQFPMRVGNRWSQVLTVKTSAGSASARVTGEVVAYESITVPAGSFMAFKTIITVNGLRFRTSWWAPETGIAVRVITVDKGQTITGELLGYQPLGDPAGAF